MYDIDGNILKVDEDSYYSGIPERCVECDCIQSKANWKDYSNKAIHVCAQCGTEYYISP